MPDRADVSSARSRRRPETGGPVLKGFVLAFLAAGLGLLLTSGRAQDFGMAGLSGLLHLALLAGLPLALYLAAATVWRRLPGPRGGPLLLTAIAIAWLLMFAGWRITAVRFSETVARGDVLIGLIEAYREDSGAYPASLSALAAAGTDLPVPALRDSTFLYALTDDGGYRLAFPAHAFMTCVRQPAFDDWICDD